MWTARILYGKRFCNPWGVVTKKHLEKFWRRKNQVLKNGKKPAAAVVCWAVLFVKHYHIWAGVTVAPGYSFAKAFFAPKQ